MQAVNKNQLFVAGCLALLVTSPSFGIRAGLMDTWKHNYQLTQKQVGIITSTAFRGFPLAIITGGMVVDIIGMKKLLVAAGVLVIPFILIVAFTGLYFYMRNKKKPSMQLA